MSERTKPRIKKLGKLLFDGRAITIKLHTKHKGGYREQDYITDMRVLSRDVRLDNRRIPFYFSLRGANQLSFTHRGAHCFVSDAKLRRELMENFSLGFAMSTDSEFKENVRNGIEQYD